MLYDAIMDQACMRGGLLFVVAVLLCVIVYTACWMLTKDPDRSLVCGLFVLALAIVAYMADRHIGSRMLTTDPVLRDYLDRAVELDKEAIDLKMKARRRILEIKTDRRSK